MNGLFVHDEMRANGSIHNRALGVMLKSNLITLQPQLQAAIAASFEAEIASGTVDCQGFVKIQAFKMAKNIIVKANSSAFFGTHLANDSAFLDAALRYPEDVVVASEALRFVPSILASKVASFITRRGRAANTLVERLTPIVNDRLNRRHKTTITGDDAMPDLIQLIVDSGSGSNMWTAEKIVQVILGVWFASVHQVAMSVVYALFDLCSHPQYVAPIREEFIKHAGQTDELVALDSFLKESARLNPSDSIAIRRKALVPFYFSDGVHVPAENVICVPLSAILRDPGHYHNAEHFDGLRFCNGSATTTISKFTHSEPSFPLWGLGKRSW
ncbi:MAG: hypothetical protein Q9167_006224 [Letrouitia subvulpina]